MKKSIYLDWNIFNKLERLDNLVNDEAFVYEQIMRTTSNSEYNIPYSNAHLNDLLTGYLKNPIYTEGHLNFIEKLTNNLCIVQYWKQPSPTIHYRSVKKFFQFIRDEIGFLPFTFTDLLKSTKVELEAGEKDIKLIEISKTQHNLVELQLETLSKTPVPKAFFNIFKTDPIFETIFPHTKVEKTLLAMCEDLYKFSMNINSDYSLYKGLKKFINITIQKVKSHKTLMTIGDVGPEGPAHLCYEKIYDQVVLDFKPTENLKYDKIINLFIKLDVSGVNSDEKFQNMFDDSLHTFYGSFCDYFITKDKKCHAKATETYSRLGISTKVMFPEDFVNHLCSKQSNQ